MQGSTISISYSTAVDILSDLMIMSLPLRILRELQVSRAQKVGLGVVFCLGFVVIAVAIIRLKQIVGEARADPVGLAVWGLVESTVSVIIGSLPPLKSFLGKQISKVSGKIYAYGAQGASHNSAKVDAGIGGSSSGGRSPFASALSKSGSRMKSESIPLEDRDGRSSNVTTLKDGQIVVQKDFGWSRVSNNGDGSASMAATDITENHSDEQGYGDEVRMMSFKEQEAHQIGVARSTGGGSRRLSREVRQKQRGSMTFESDMSGRIKTSWLN